MNNMTSTTQPKYSESPHKFMARELNMRLYRLITGNYSMPINKQYITLANVQNESPTSEINQFVNSKLLIKSQFVGIDDSKRLINRNKKLHPQAEFIHGDWNKVITSNNFNPGFIYLDSTYFADRKPALDALRNTMSICDQGALLICNVMETNPRYGTGTDLNAQALISGLLEGQIAEAFIDWNKNEENPTVEDNENSIMNIFSYVYRTTGKTKMRSFLFYKGVLPLESQIDKLFDEFDSWCEKEFNKFIDVERFA
jgi:hypothetical protein